MHVVYKIILKLQKISG